MQHASVRMEASASLACSPIVNVQMGALLLLLQTALSLLVVASST